MGVKNNTSKQFQKLKNISKIKAEIKSAIQPQEGHPFKDDDNKQNFTSTLPR